MLQWNRWTAKSLVLPVKRLWLYEVSDPFSDDGKIFLQAPSHWREKKNPAKYLVCLYLQPLLNFLPSYYWTFQLCLLIIWVSIRCSTSATNTKQQKGNINYSIFKHFNRQTQNFPIHALIFEHTFVFVFVFFLFFITHSNHLQQQNKDKDCIR